MPLFRRFDPSLAADLRTQRSTLIKGLVCVLVTALLTGVTLKLLEGSITAIQEAAPLVLSQREARIKTDKEIESRAADLAPLLNRSASDIAKALKEIQPALETTQNARQELILAQRLGVPVTAVRDAFAQTRNRVAGNIGAVYRLGQYSLLVILAFLIKYWFTRGQTYYLSRAAARLTNNLRLKLFDKLMKMPVSYFGEKRVGAIESILTNDVNVYGNAISIVRDSIDGPTKALIAFAYIVWTQWQLAAITLLFLPVMAFVIQRNGQKMRVAQRDVQRDLADLGALSNEALQGTRVVKAFAAEAEIGTTYDQLAERTFLSQMRTAQLNSSLRPLVELIGATALATVLFLCGWLSYQGVLRLGEVAALVYALDQVNQGLRSIGNVNTSYNQVAAASQRIHEEILDVPDPHAEESGRILDAPEGRIEFRDVSFRYPDGTEALSEVSFVIPAGTSLALVGPSGAGKSTIADLMLRFYEPTRGSILLDGVDIRELNVQWLRRQIGVVPQQTFLFAGSIAANIRLGNRSATEEEFALATKMAHVDEFVNQMPEGFASEMGERGVKVSGGQMQRIAIARALIRQPKLLLLDEATSALDATSEKAVTEALEEVMKRRTTLFIAHRLTTAARADRILVISRGRVVEQGGHDQLLAANGAYAGLFRAFSGGVLG